MILLQGEHFKKEKVINWFVFLRLMIKREVLGQLLDSKKAAILNAVLHSHEEMTLKEIAQKSKVPMATTFRILQNLAAQGILNRREWKTSKVYSCSANEKTEFLKELFYDEYDGVHEFVQVVGNLPEVQNILLHGSQRKGKANLLVIGENLDAGKIEEASQKVREKGFDLTYLPLTRKQYEQMAKMGLYAGEKRVLK